MAIVVQGKRRERTSFTLKDPDGNPQEFSVRGIPGWSFLEIFATSVAEAVSKQDEIRNDAKGAALVLELFEDAIGDPEMFTRFRDFVRDSKNGFDLEELMDLLHQLAEEVTKRPTEPSASSRGGRKTTKATSTVAAS